MAEVKPDSKLVEQRNKAGANVDLERSKEVPLWERDDAPKGSTSESLLHYENGQPVRVSGPTHYSSLADGRLIGGYGIGTHHSEEKDGQEVITPIVATYGG
jgi:hypothetical protein